MTTVRRAIVFSFLESYLAVVINLVSFVLLARLLTPAQVGLFSVAMAIISITQVIRDFGLVNFLIQKKELSDEHIATAWALALMFGASLFAIVQIAAPFIGRFYNDDSLTDIARLVAINFLILPFNSICLALLRRAMNFQVVMRINLSAAFLSTAATLTLAWLGVGAFSLALGAVINNAIVAIGIVLAGAAKRLLAPKLTHWREILGFGGPLTVANVITSASMDINDLAVGKILGFQPVAIISRAQGIMNLFHRDFMNAIRNVALPAFSKANRSGDSIEEKFVSSVGNVSVVAWTFYGFAGLFPLEVLRLMFGPQWDLAAPLIPIFCLAGVAGAMNSLVPTVLLAAGQSTTVAMGEMFLQPVKAISLCLVVYYYRNLQVFAIGFMLMAIVSVPYWFVLKERHLPTDFGKLTPLMVKNFLLVGLSLAPATAVVMLLRPSGKALSYPVFFGCAAVTCLAWLVLLRGFRHPLYQEFLAILTTRFPSGRDTKSL